MPANGNTGSVKIKTGSAGFTKDREYSVNTMQCFDSYRVPTARFFLAIDDAGKDKQLDIKEATSIVITPGAV